MSRRRDVRALRKVFDDREAKARTMRAMRTVARAPDGAVLQVALDGTCPERSSGNTTSAIGEVTLQPTRFGPASRGFSGLRTLTEEADAALRDIDRLQPRQLLIGRRQTVAVYGAGLDASFLMDFLLGGDSEDGTIHPELTVHEIEVFSDTFAEIDVSVAVSAFAADDLPVAFR